MITLVTKQNASLSSAEEHAATQYLEMRVREGPAARHLAHGAAVGGGRAVQLRHDAEVARQPVEALERQHRVRVLHRHRVLDREHCPVTVRRCS